MNIRTKRGQEAIQPSTVIHWDKVSKGLSVGLYKNDSLRWYARCFHQGKYHKKNLPFATDFKTAVVEANRFEAHLKDGKHQSRQQKSETKRTGQMTVRELMDEYLRVPVIDKAEPMNSVRGSDRAAQKHSRGEHADWKREQDRRYKADWSHLDDVLVVDVTKDMLADHRKLLQRKVTKSGKLVSPDTINRQMVPLNSALAYAVEEGYIAKAP